jgi:iron complex outermembrane receptor protein
MGVFGQGTFHVNDQWGLVGGLRYSKDTIRRFGTIAAGPAPAVPNNADVNSSKVTWRVGANYQMTPTDLFYASVATGYKAAGFNDFDPATGLAAGPQPYEAENMIAYEVGYKGLPLQTLRFNSGVFYYDYSKNQVSSSVLVGDASCGPTNTATCANVVWTRAVPTTIYGWENELTWQIVQGTQLALTIALEKSKWNNFMAGQFQTRDWSGDSLDNTPAFVSMLTFTQEWGLPNDARLKLRLFSKYNSSYLLSNFAGSATTAFEPYHYTQKAYTRSDASLTYTPAGNAWYLQAYVQNIENKLQALSAPGGNFLPDGLLPTGVAPGASTPSTWSSASLQVSSPRTGGVRIGIDF